MKYNKNIEKFTHTEGMHISAIDAEVKATLPSPPPHPHPTWSSTQLGGLEDIHIRLSVQVSKL